MSRSVTKSSDTSLSVQQSVVKSSGDSTSNLKPILPSGKTAHNEIASEIVSALKEFLRGLAPDSIQAGPTGLHETKSGHVIDTSALSSNTLQDMDLSFEIVKLKQPEARQATPGNSEFAKHRMRNIRPVQKIRNIEKPFGVTDRRGSRTIHTMIDLPIQDVARAYRDVHHKHGDNPEPKYIRSLVKGKNRQTKRQGQGHQDFPIPFRWQQNAQSQFKTKLRDQRTAGIPVESRGYLFYPRDMFDYQNPFVEPQQRHIESKALVKDSLSRFQGPIDRSELIQKMERLSREYVKPVPTRQLQVKRGLRQTTKYRSNSFYPDYFVLKLVRRTKSDTKSSSMKQFLRKRTQSRRAPMVISSASIQRSRQHKRGSHVYRPSKLRRSRQSQFRKPKLSSSLGPRLSKRRRFSRQSRISRRQQRNPNLIRYSRQPSPRRYTESRSNNFRS